MSVEYSLPIVPTDPKIPEFFPDGFPFPLAETPPEILDVILRVWPEREYRVDAPYPVSKYSKVKVSIHSPVLKNGHYRAGYLVFTNRGTSLRTSFRLSNSVSAKISYRWKSSHHFSVHVEAKMAQSPTSDNPHHAVFTVERKKRTTRYLVTLPQNYTPEAYWEAGVPVTTTKYSKSLTYLIPAHENLVYREFAPQFTFPIPEGIVELSELFSFFKSADSPLAAGVFPIQKQLGDQLYAGWSR